MARKMTRKVLTVEVETDLSNVDLKRLTRGLVASAEASDRHLRVIQTQVNAVDRQDQPPAAPKAKRAK